MFTIVAEKFGVFGLFVRRQRYALITWACVLAFVSVMIYAFTVVSELEADVLDYEGKIAVLSSRMERWEQAAEDNVLLSAENRVLEAQNGRLEIRNENLGAANGELERQNGELLKKYDGLSKPN